MTDLEFVVDLAERAGTLAAAAASTASREFKADQSLVTDVDRGIEAMVREEIGARFPGDGFYGEEGGGAPLAHDRLWVVDPIDGTTNMVFGLPVWGVSIGLCEGGEPRLGAFHLPRLGESFWFERGGGAFLNGRRLPLTQQDHPLHQEDPVAIGSEAIFVLDFDRFRCRQRNLGSLAAHYCYTAAGFFRASVSVRDRLHDLGAGYGVALEAGCTIEFLDGGPAPFASFLENPLNLRPLVVAPPAVLGQIRGVLRERPSGIDSLWE
jgi:myo-inositol-1(or 4)-monophosphatase